MSEAPVSNTGALQGSAVPPATVISAPLTAIQILEQQIQNFIQQHEKAIANVHAIEGAIQASQHLLARLRQEEVKAVEFAKQVVSDASTVKALVVEEAKAVEETMQKAFGTKDVQVLGVVEKS